eukprot:6679387-Prorocentrum_lima.AAC.1
MQRKGQGEQRWPGRERHRSQCAVRVQGREERWDCARAGKTICGQPILRSWSAQMIERMSRRMT